MQPKWRRGYGGVGSGVKTSWLAPHGANQPSCSALPSLRRHHPASPNPQRSTHLPQAPLEEFRAPNELETVKTVKETSSHILTAGEQRNIWEDSTLLHLQKKPTVKLGKHFPSLLLSYWGERKTEGRILEKSDTQRTTSFRGSKTRVPQTSKSLEPEQLSH